VANVVAKEKLLVKDESGENDGLRSAYNYCRRIPRSIEISARFLVLARALKALVTATLISVPTVIGSACGCVDANAFP
jgi:hypothetical protein